VPAEDARWRAGRAQAVRAALAPETRTAFGGPEFFPYDRALRLRAMLEPVPAEQLRLATSDGTVRQALRVGRLHLGFPAGRATLAVYRLADVADSEHLFLPFRDALAGKETYGAGRYVEVARLPGGVLEVDFNRAYNPDCAYGITAQCPIAPAENTLPFAVRGGERMPGGH
jgi:hypothetical protein